MLFAPSLAVGVSSVLKTQSSFGKKKFLVQSTYKRNTEALEKQEVLHILSVCL